MRLPKLVAYLCLALAVWSGAACAQTGPSAQASLTVDQIADLMVRLCVGGGRTQAVTGGGSAGADISLRSLDVTGNLKGEFKLNRSSAEGLINGLDNALTQLAADQANQVRTCLQPVRQRLLDLVLPPPQPPPPPPPKPIVEKTFRYDTPARCFIDSDIRFCGFVGGVGTVTLRGAADSHDFFLTIKGELQPQVTMNGSELVIATPTVGSTNDKTAIVHRIHRGAADYWIDETVEFKDSRFPLGEISDVRLKAVSHFP